MIEDAFNTGQTELSPSPSRYDANGVSSTRFVDLHQSLSHDQGVSMYMLIMSTLSITGTIGVYVECR